MDSLVRDLQYALKKKLYLTCIPTRGKNYYNSLIWVFEMAGWFGVFFLVYSSELEWGVESGSPPPHPHPHSPA